MPRSPAITIVIPALNEERTITSVLRSLARQDMISDVQVIVVDGQSVDGTVDVAHGFPFVQVASCAPGRARQMNHGASLAEAPVLWFLHADSTIPEPGTINLLVNTMRDPEVAGGAFRFHLRGDDGYYKVVNALVNFRSSVLRRPYGDQGIFVRASVFTAVGGFRELPACDDLDLVFRIRRAGRFAILRYAVETSARTWQRYGKVRTTAAHLGQWLSFEFGRLFRPVPRAPMELPEKQADRPSRGGFQGTPGDDSRAAPANMGTTQHHNA